MSQQQNAVMALDELGLAPSKYADDSSFALVSTASNFLPRLQLFGGNSDACKESKIGMGRWGIVKSKDDIQDLTAECPFLALDWRPKALQITDEQIISVYDAKSAEFKRIALKSAEKDSGCMFGPEFLVWCPTSQIPCFVTLFFGSKTARREATNVKALIGRPGLLKVQLIRNKKFSWHGPVVVPYSQNIILPDVDDIKEQIEAFRNPPESEVEAAAPETAERAR